ncbi:MAG: restriction endonuclease subunit S [Simplicispira sp.]|nr:restriction endonuclease subunit S [Simplicispira sp.]
MAAAPGGVARLRELILTLAVQGKLVPQDPKDEPASELLKKIRAEKDRLIAEGKIKRDKPLAGIGEEEKPFGFPVGWEWVRLPEIYYSISPSGSKLLSSAVQTEGKHPVVDQGQRHIAGYTNDDSLLIEVPGPVIVFGDHTKEIKYIDFDFVAGADGTKILRPVQQDERFFAWQLRSFPLEDRGYARHFKVLNSCFFALPPLAEQSRIVTRVEELMRLCDALEAKGQLEARQHAQLVSTLLATLSESETPAQLADNWQRIATHFDLLLDRPQAVDALEQTILQLAVRGLLVPQDRQDEPASVLLKKIRAEKDKLILEGKIKRDKPLPPIAEEEQPFALPQGWEWVRFGQIANIASNLVPPALHAKKWQVAPDCIEKATGRLLHRRTVAQAEIISPNHLFKPGQILYSKIRPSLSKAVLVDFEGLCSADMYPIESPLDSEYLLMYILSQPFLEQVSIAENRVKMPKLNQEALVAFTVALPPLAEQSRIVTRVTQLRRLCADLRQHLTASQSTQAHLAEALVQEEA